MKQAERKSALEAEKLQRTADMESSQTFIASSEDVDDESAEVAATLLGKEFDSR